MNRLNNKSIVETLGSSDYVAAIKDNKVVRLKVEFLLNQYGGPSGTLAPADADPEPAVPSWYFGTGPGNYTNLGINTTADMVFLVWNGTAWSAVEIDLDLSTVEANVEAAVSAKAEAEAIQLLRLHDPNLVFSGFVNTSTPTPAHTANKAYFATESGTVFGISGVVKGQIVVDDGSGFEVESFNENILKYTVGKNLFNKDKRIDGFYLNVSNGGLTADALFYTTDFIPIKPNTNYYKNHSAISYYCWYDINKTYISFGSASTNIMTSPSNAYYLRHSLGYTNKSPDELQIEQSDVGTDYEPYGHFNDYFRIYFDKIINVEINASELKGLSNSVNLFNSVERVAYGASNPTYYWSNYIAVSEGDVVRRNYGGVKYWGIYDSNKDVINEYIAGSSEYTVPAGVSYIRSVYEDIIEDDLMITVNNEIPAHYVNYGLIFDAPLLTEHTSNKNVANGYVGLDENSKIKKEFIDSNIFPFSGKKLGALGDSITYGYVPRNSLDFDYPGVLDSYAKIAAARLEMDFLNYSVSGTLLSDHFLTRYLTMADDLDIITVLGGTNDIRNSVPLGVMSDRNASTYYGALHLLAQGLIDKYIIANDLLGSVVNTQASDATNPQIDTITLSGSKGDCYIRGTADLVKLLTFNTSLSQTASDFVTNYAADYAAEGITITSSGADIIFTAQLDNIPFTSPVVLPGKPKGIDKKIVFITPIKLGNSYGTTYGGYTIQDWGNAVKEVADYYSLPCFDAESLSGINPHINKTLQGWQDGHTSMYNPLIPDGTHPSQEGHEIFADAFVGFLKTLF